MTRYAILKKLLILPILLFLVNCSDDSAGPDKNDDFVVRILSASDSSAINNANVVVYNADNNEALTREATDSDGECAFDLEPGNYYARISAQGYRSSPPQNNMPVPFAVTGREDVARTIYLNPLQELLPGQVSGYIDPVLSNVLIIASGSVTTDEFTTVSGPDGYFVLYNLPYDVYGIQAFKAGYQADTLYQVSLNDGNPDASVTIHIKETTGAVLQGKVTFLASENYFVDISLINEATFSAIPGLSTVSDTGSLGYYIENIPQGTFQAWASFKNDGYVMDPDWIYRNPGVLSVAFSEKDTINLNFSVTDAVLMVGPTNPADSVYAVVADSTIPVFQWLPYPSAKEYIVEVRKLNGEIIWGGFNTDGTVNHAFINQQTSQVVFNFDGSATENLIPGEIYQWKVYADNGRDPNVQTLLSSSEDQLGVFKIK